MLTSSGESSRVHVGPVAPFNQGENQSNNTHASFNLVVRMAIAVTEVIARTALANNKPHTVRENLYPINVFTRLSPVDDDLVRRSRGATERASVGIGHKYPI